MTTLATIADYEALTGETLTTAEQARVWHLIEMASDAVLAGAHGQTITSAAHTAEVLYPHDGVVYFPQRPVTAVSAVSVNGTALTANDYRWTAGGDRLPAKLVRRVNGYDSFWGYGWSNAWGEVAVTVTYVAGWVTVPGQIRSAVCAMAKGAIVNAGGPRQASASVGPFSASYDLGDAQSSAMTLTPAVRAMLDRTCGVDAVGAVGTPRGTP